MTFIFIDPARRKKRKVQKSAESQAVLDALDEYLEGNIQEPVKWLARFWKDQAAVFTYRELLTLVTDESEPEKLFDTWFKDYSKLLAEKITPMWQSAFLAGANTNPIINGIGYQVNTSETSVREWILNRGAELVTNVTEDQVNAVRYIIAESQANKMGSAETARYIRPTVGLTERQAAANLRLYNTTKEQLRADHPRMTDESIERKARAIAGRYAQSQQMTRAETIARTEVAFAYNQGNDTAIRQAMSQGLVPIMRKVWSTADDGHVCPACEDLEGTEIDMDSEFKVTVGKKVKRTLSCSIPPMHPRCKCAVMYEETGEYVQNPIENPQEDDTMMAEEPFQIDTGGKRNEEELTDEQIKDAKAAAVQQGYDGDIYYSANSNTAFHGSIEGDPFHYLVIGTDAYPKQPPGSTANEQVSMNGCMAHEVVGHYEAWKKGTDQTDPVLEEVQASIRASRFGVDLTEDEREILLKDALERLEAEGLKLEDVIGDLDILER